MMASPEKSCEVKRKRRNNKRKRQDAAAAEPTSKSSRNRDDLSNGRNKRKQRDSPLGGMVVAVSTLDVKGQAHSDVDTSYKSVVEACQQAGATVTGQVHGRVTCLLCSRSAVRNGTQRVRKALKKNISLVDIAWVHQCQSAGKRVDHEPYRLDELGKEMLKARTNKSKPLETMASNDSKAELDHVEDLLEQAWSEPVGLGCCCVCHENGDDKCPWCTECSVNMAKAK